MYERERNVIKYFTTQTVHNFISTDVRIEGREGGGGRVESAGVCRNFSHPNTPS